MYYLSHKWIDIPETVYERSAKLLEYRENIRLREEELSRSRRKIEEEEKLIYLGGVDHGKYIITSNGKVRQG